MNIFKKSFTGIGPSFFIMFFLLVGFSKSFGQQKSELLLLKDAINTASANNAGVQSATIDESIAKEKYKQSNAGFLPQLNFSYSALATNNPLNVFGFKLQQKIVNATDFNPDLLNNPSSTSDFTTKIELLQPIINFDVTYMKKGAKAQVESLQHKTKRTKEYLVFETQKAYNNLQMAHQAVIVLEEALATTKAIYEFTNNRVAQGLIQKSDLLNVEVQVLGIESNIAEAKANVLNVSDYLSVLMNRPVGVLYKTEEMKQEEKSENEIVEIPQNRSDFLSINKAIEATSLIGKAAKMKSLPRLNAFGSFQLNDKKLAGFNAASYMAGIQLTWNIFDGNNIRHQVAGLKLEQDKLGVQLKSMQHENKMMLDKAFRDLNNSQFKIKQQNSAITQADEALRILENRYKEGLVNTIDVLTAQTQLAQQKLMLAQAILNNNISRAYIQFLTSTNN